MNTKFLAHFTAALAILTFSTQAAEKMTSKMITPTDKPAEGLERAVFGGGCFWCVEAVFERVPGIKDAQSGYAGGHKPNPTYEEICTHTTGHAEAGLVDYDPKMITYDKVLDIFWHAHDPTTLNRQGNDIGDNYRSIILTLNNEQKAAAGKLEGRGAKELAVADRHPDRATQSLLHRRGKPSGLLPAQTETRIRTARS